jgi:general secretion pathway protein C
MMMKRLPLVVSFVLFVALCASIAYWAMQMFKPPVRPVAAPPRAVQAEVKPEAAAALFGGGRTVAVASNYQLRGVVMSGTGSESVAIISADGKPAQAIRMNTELLPGVTVKEVHRDYVLLSEGGVTKRVELPESAKAQVDVATASPVATTPVRPALTRPSPTGTPQMGTPGAAPQGVNSGPPPGMPPPGYSAANPPPSPEPGPTVTTIPNPGSTPDNTSGK